MNSHISVQSEKQICTPNPRIFNWAVLNDDHLWLRTIKWWQKDIESRITIVFTELSNIYDESSENNSHLRYTFFDIFST